MRKDSEIFGVEFIQKDCLIIVIDEESDEPVRLALVKRKGIDNDMFDVKYGPQEHQIGFVSPEDAFMVVQTKGEFDDPRAAFMHYLPDIVIEVLIAIRMSKDLQTIRRLKAVKRRLDKRLRNRIGHGLLGLLGHLPIVGGRNRAQ